jgi:hypothetical protein
MKQAHVFREKNNDDRPACSWAPLTRNCCFGERSKIRCVGLCQEKFLCFACPRSKSNTPPYRTLTLSQQWVFFSHWSCKRMKSKCNHSRYFDAVQFNNSRLRGRKELKASVQRCLRDKGCLSSGVNASRSSLPPRSDRRSPPLPTERVVRRTVSSAFQFFCRPDQHKMQEKRAESSNACHFDNSDRDISVQYHNRRRSSSPSSALDSRKLVTMSGRGQHSQEKRHRSVSPDAHAERRRASSPTAERVSSRTTENLHPFRQCSKRIQVKRFVSPDLNSKMHLPSSRVRPSSPYGDVALDEISIVAVKMCILPSFLGKVKSVSQSAHISDEITLDPSANAPMSCRSKPRRTRSSVIMAAASAAVARVKHFITHRRARSRYMIKVGKDRRTYPKQSELAFTAGEVEESREGQRTKELATLNESIDEIFPSLTTAYLGISLLSMESTTELSE